MSFIRGNASSIRNGSRDMSIVLVIDNIKLEINVNREIGIVRTRTNRKATTCMVQPINQDTNPIEAKRLISYHAIGNATYLDNKLIKGTTTILIELINEDINKNLMIPIKAIEIIKGECDNFEDTWMT